MHGHAPWQPPARQPAAVAPAVATSHDSAHRLRASKDELAAHRNGTLPSLASARPRLHVPADAASPPPASGGNRPPATLTRMQSSVRSPGAGGGPPPNVRKASSSIREALVPPRQRLSPGKNRAASAAVGGSSGSPQFARHSYAAAITAAAINGEDKPCSVLGCEGKRVLGEGYCTSHLGESLAGLKLSHKRSNSVLQRMLNQSQGITTSAAAQARHNGMSATTPANAAAVLSRSRTGGLASVAAFDILGITEEKPSSFAAARKQLAPLGRTMPSYPASAPSSTPSLSRMLSTRPPPPGSASPLSRVAPSASLASLRPAPLTRQATLSRTTPAASTSQLAASGPAEQAALFLRHTSIGGSKGGRSGATVLAQGSIAEDAPFSPLSDDLPPSQPRFAADDPVWLLSRTQSYGLASESMPAPSEVEDNCVAELPFHRLWFALPPSLDAFVLWREKLAATPEGAAVALLVALLLWSEGKEGESGGVGWGKKHTGSKALQRTAVEGLSGVGARGGLAGGSSQSIHEDGADDDGDGHDVFGGAPHIDDEDRRVMARLSSLTRRGTAPPQPQQHKLARLASFKRPSPAAKKLQFKNASLSATPGQLNLFAAAGFGSEGSPGGWTMESRWCALIACIHPDQTVPTARAVAAAGGVAVPSYRGRSLCALDVDTLNDSFENCPQLARSFVAGCSAANQYALPASSFTAPATPVNRLAAATGTATTLPGTVYVPPASKQLPLGCEDEPEDGMENERTLALRLLAEGVGPYAFRLARHPFAGGTADANAEKVPFALLMVHNAALKYPRSVKLRRDGTGRWKVVHWWNLLATIR